MDNYKRELKRRDPFWGLSDSERAQPTKVCAHDWTGPEIEIKNGSSVSCARCGILAINEDIWNGYAKE